MVKHAQCKPQAEDARESGRKSGDGGAGRLMRHAFWRMKSAHALGLSPRPSIAGVRRGAGRAVRFRARAHRREARRPLRRPGGDGADPRRKSTRLNSSHITISYAVFCLKKKKKQKKLASSKKKTTKNTNTTKEHLYT